MQTLTNFLIPEKMNCHQTFYTNCFFYWMPGWPEPREMCTLHNKEMCCGRRDRGMDVSLFKCLLDVALPWWQERERHVWKQLGLHEAHIFSRRLSGYVSLARLDLVTMNTNFSGIVCLGKPGEESFPSTGWTRGFYGQGAFEVTKQNIQHFNYIVIHELSCYPLVNECWKILGLWRRR